MSEEQYLFDPNPGIWGPGMWRVLFTHVIKINDFIDGKINDVDIRLLGDSFHALIQNMIINLPCQTCKEHLIKYVSIYPVPINKGKMISNWLLHYYNEVRTISKKHQQKMEDLERFIKLKTVYQKFEIISVD